VRYVLTPAGHELRPVVEALGVWGTRWIGQLGDEHLDPKLLMWDMHRNIDHDAVPGGRTVVQFRFPDVPAGIRDWWLVITSGEADVCDPARPQPGAGGLERARGAARYGRRLSAALVRTQRVSRCAVCLLHFGQCFLNSSRSGSLRRFLRVM
jgi:hypothetical protein